MLKAPEKVERGLLAFSNVVSYQEGEAKAFCGLTRLQLTRVVGDLMLAGRRKVSLLLRWVLTRIRP